MRKRYPDNPDSKASVERAIEKEPTEVSQAFLLSVFGSTDFQSLLKIAASKARQKRDEFGFGILKDPYSNKVWLGKVVGNNYLSNYCRCRQLCLLQLQSKV